jgi:hypothetical protein
MLMLNLTVELDKTHTFGILGFWKLFPSSALTSEKPKQYLLCFGHGAFL